MQVSPTIQVIKFLYHCGANKHKSIVVLFHMLYIKDTSVFQRSVKDLEFLVACVNLIYDNKTIAYVRQIGF